MVEKFGFTDIYAAPGILTRVTQNKRLRNGKSYAPTSKGAQSSLQTAELSELFHNETQTPRNGRKLKLSQKTA